MVGRWLFDPCTLPLSSSDRTTLPQFGDQGAVSLEGGLRGVVIAQNPELMKKVRIRAIPVTQGEQLIVRDIEFRALRVDGACLTQGNPPSAEPGAVERLGSSVI